MESEVGTALKENRCYICGTTQGKQIKVLNEIYQTQLTVKNFIPICNLCLSHYPQQDLDLIHLTWFILEKRLNQQTVYTKLCRNCEIPITTARKEKTFCSNNCRAKYWQKQAKFRS